MGNCSLNGRYKKNINLKYTKKFDLTPDNKHSQNKFNKNISKSTIDEPNKDIIEKFRIKCPKSCENDPKVIQRNPKVIPK